jgi:hypothetical protein
MVSHVSRADALIGSKGNIASHPDADTEKVGRNE